MKIENLEHLDNILSEKENTIEKLKNKIEKLKQQKDAAKNEWQIEYAIPENDYRKDLPVPRLEMRIVQSSNFQYAWHYGIVYKHYADVGCNEQLRFKPLNYTTTSDILISKKPYLPFRDGIHIRADIIHFNLRAYLTRDNDSFITEIAPLDNSSKIEEYTIKSKPSFPIIDR